MGQSTGCNFTSTQPERSDSHHQSLESLARGQPESKSRRRSLSFGSSKESMLLASPSPELQFKQSPISSEDGTDWLGTFSSPTRSLLRCRSASSAIQLSSPVTGNIPRSRSVSGDSFGAVLRERTNASVTPARAPKRQRTADAALETAVDQFVEGTSYVGDQVSLPKLLEPHRMDPSIRQLSRKTVHEMLNGQHTTIVDQFLIVDCRFPFEYDGGHINGAVNWWNADRAIHALFIERVLRLGNGGRTVVVFHCEFSSHRAPTMLLKIQALDKYLTRGADGYLLPELYVMEGGYSKYWDDYPSDCTPKGYTKMKDKRFASDNTQCESIMRRGWETTTNVHVYTAARSAIAQLEAAVAEHGVTSAVAHLNMNQLLAISPAGHANATSPRTPQSQVIV